MKKKKLKLNRETLSKLDGNAGRNVVGGGWSEFSNCNLCNTEAQVCIETAGCDGTVVGCMTDYCCSNSGGPACTVGC